MTGDPTIGDDRSQPKLASIKQRASWSVWGFCWRERPRSSLQKSLTLTSHLPTPRESVSATLWSIVLIAYVRLRHTKVPHPNKLTDDQTDCFSTSEPSRIRF